MQTDDFPAERVGGAGDEVLKGCTQLLFRLAKRDLRQFVCDRGGELSQRGVNWRCRRHRSFGIPLLVISRQSTTLRKRGQSRAVLQLLCLCLLAMLSLTPISLC